MISQSALCAALTAKNFKAVGESLPKTIQDALEQPTINEVIKVVGREGVTEFIESELIKMAAMISVGGTLTKAQVPFIAGQLLEIFPNESLADFRLCFQRGCMGQYGEIFRMDGIVLRGWMEKYLDEKYQVLENNLAKQKDTYKDVAPAKEAKASGKDWLAEWRKAIEEQPGGGKVPAMTTDDVLKFGQEKPVKKAASAGYSYFQVRNIQVPASTQEHAEELVQLMLKRKTLIENSDGTLSQNV